MPENLFSLCAAAVLTVSTMALSADVVQLAPSKDNTMFENS